MPALRCARPQNELFRRCLAGCLDLLIACAVQVPGAQRATATHKRQVQSRFPRKSMRQSSQIAPLEDLLSEAERNNPQIQSMRLGLESRRTVSFTCFKPYRSAIHRSAGQRGKSATLRGIHQQ